MKIAVCTIGSTGDVQPYLALALSLQAAGHSVRVISHPFHQARFAAHGIAFRPCGPVVSQQELNEMLDKMLATRNPLKQLKMLMLEAFFAEGESYFRSAKAALQDCDLAVIHMVDFLSHEAAAQLGMPRITGILAPPGIPTRHVPPPHFPDLGQVVNRLGWKMAQAILGIADRAAADYLQRLGGPSVEIGMFCSLAPHLNFLACSPTLGPTFPDLPKNIEVVGPWILENKDFTAPDPLVDFLKEHPEPVAVSFGSMGGTKGPALAKTVLEALEICKLPAIIQGGYAGLQTKEAPSNVFFADVIPHEWLFPRVRCVVHHAGAGTSTTVARAGKPHVPVVFIADQPYFADNLGRLGIATKKLWYWQMKPGNLAARIQQAYTSADMHAKAKSLQPTIVAETGNERTVTRIEKFMRDLHR